MSQTVEKSPAYRQSAETKRIATKLQALDVGQKISWEALANAIQEPVGSPRLYACVISARRHLRREERMIFDTIKSVGLVRLTDAQIVDTGHRSRRKIRKAARECVKTVSSANYNELPRDKQNEYNITVACMGTIGYMSKGPTPEKSKAQLANTQSFLDQYRNAILGVSE